MAKPLVLDLHIPYYIRPGNYLAYFNAVGSNAEKNAYMDALKREVLSYEGELDGYEIRAVHLSGGSASVMAPDLLGDVLRTVRTHLPVAQGAEVSYDSLPVTIGLGLKPGDSALLCMSLDYIAGKATPCCFWQSST